MDERGARAGRGHPVTQGDVPLTGLELARRLERAEGATNAAFIDARADLHPEVGAEWIEVAGVFAMYDAPRSPRRSGWACSRAEGSPHRLHAHEVAARRRMTSPQRPG